MGDLKKYDSQYISKPHNQLPLQKGAGESPVKICPKCHAVYFDKHWHSNKFLHQAYSWHTQVGYELCPEDKWTAGSGGSINYEGEELRLGFNSRYLIDAISTIDSEKLLLDIRGKQNPGVIRATNGPNHTSVVMPMRI